MDKDFFSFVTDTTKENFLAARAKVLADGEYDPYSDDLAKLEKLLDEGKWEEVAATGDINTLLSPRAHLIKQFACSKLDRADAAKAELILAHKILEGIDLTGDGTADYPYIITRVSDERDFLQYIDEQFAGQGLVDMGGKKMDVIRTAAGREIYFDITDCFSRMQVLMGQGRHGLEQLLGKPTNARPTKKWWQFWKR
jgi:hypothetical protein